MTEDWRCDNMKLYPADIYLFKVRSTWKRCEILMIFYYRHNYNTTVNNQGLYDIIMVSFLLLKYIKVALSSLRQFLAAESPFKMMKSAFYFMLKALFVLKIFKFLSWLFDHVAKLLDKKDKVNFKFYDVTTCLTNNCNSHIAQYLEK